MFFDTLPDFFNNTFIEPEINNFSAFFYHPSNNLENLPPILTTKNRVENLLSETEQAIPNKEDEKCLNQI